MGVAIFLAVIALFVVLLNPFKTVPQISVKNAYWELNRKGYVLVLTVTTTEPAELVGVDAGKFYRVAYDVNPPNPTLRIQLDNIASSVRLYFTYGNPISVTPEKAFAQKLDLNVVFGNRRLFLLGTLPWKGVVLVVPIRGRGRVALYLPPNAFFDVRGYVRANIPEFKGAIITLYNGTPETVFSNYTTLIFDNIAPSPRTLDWLVRMGKHVVLFSWEWNVGEERFDLVNGSVVVYTNRYSPQKSDIDYFGAHCEHPVYSANLKTNIEIIKQLEKFAGPVAARNGIMPSTYCLGLFTDKYVVTDRGDVVLGRTKHGFYFASVTLKLLIYLAMSGFFDGNAGNVYVEELHPFKGIYPVSASFGSGTYLVSVYTKKGALVKMLETPPVTFSRSGNIITLTVGVNKQGHPIWKGAGKVRIEEITYDGDLVGVVTKTVLAFPTSINIDLKPFEAYILYVNDTPVSLIADEAPLEHKPSVRIEHGNTCEFFFLKVERTDDLNTPLVLYVNGKAVDVLWGRSTWESTKCRPGFYSVEVEDVYGRVVAEAYFKIGHIYEQPIFIVGVLSLLAVVSMTYVAFKRKTEKEVEEAVLVFYKLPEREEKTVTEFTVADTISKLSTVKRCSPTVAEVLDGIYKRHHLLKTINDATVALGAFLKHNKAYGIYSRYVPEIDDTISLVGLKSRLARDFYLRVLTELMKKFGGTYVPKEEVEEILDIDCVLILGKRVVILTFAPTVTDIKQSIDRALTAFTIVRRMRLPYVLVGFGIITEPKLTRTVNSFIDAILSQDKEVAGKILRDMTVYEKIIAEPKEAWLSHYAMVAVPVTRLAPFMAFIKMGAVRICNKYYRLTTFVGEL